VDSALLCVPTDLTDDLIELIARGEICSYVDLPLQHIDDEILKKMRGKGDSRLSGPF